MLFINNIRNDVFSYSYFVKSVNASRIRRKGMVTQMEKINSSKYSFTVAVVVILLIMLVCNFLTDMMADDYFYSFSFSDGTRIENIGDIIPSMSAHYQIMNGRIVAHFLVQVFLLLPHFIFKLLNAGIFVLQAYLVYRIANIYCTRNTLLFCMIFGSIWIFCPAFGQVNLWLDGSINYLWCCTFNLLFLLPFIRKYLFNKDIESGLGKVIFVFSGFLVGGYGENAALSTLIMAVLLLGLCVFKKHLTVKSTALYIYILVLTTFCIGFYIMMTAPATIQVKLPSEYSISTIFYNFSVTLSKFYDQFRVIVIALSVLFVLDVLNRVNTDKVVIASVMTLGALCSYFALVFARGGYPDRSTAYCAILLITACAILFSELWKTKYFEHCVCLGVVIILFTLYFGILGCKEIYATHVIVQKNEIMIAECKARGVTEVEVLVPDPQVKYSPLWNLPYVNPDVSNVWPNTEMARYYGIDVVTGKVVQGNFVP